MMSTPASNPSAVKPARIRGTVPNDYRGPLYYRVATFSYQGNKKGLHELVSFEDRKAVARLAKVDIGRAAQRNDVVLCDANGELLPEWRTPLKAKLKGSAGKTRNWVEFAATFMSTVSPRIKDIIEEFAPGIHYFIPVDVDDGQGGSFRAFFFVCGAGWFGRATALEASGFTETTTTFAGEVVPAPPDLIGSERFAYLDAAVIGRTPLFYDGELSFVFCADLVERLGDILPSGKAFVPMGVA